MRGCEGHMLATFAVMLSFAAPLLKYVDMPAVGLVLAGPPSSTKPLLAIAASAIDGPDAAQVRQYSLAAARALGDPDGTVAAHRDLPLIVDQLSPRQPGMSEKAAGWDQGPAA